MTPKQKFAYAENRRAVRAFKKWSKSALFTMLAELDTVSTRAHLEARLEHAFMAGRKSKDSK